MAYSKLFAIQEGDCMLTFGGFSCTGPNVIVQIYRDQAGLYFVCADGKHHLESQLDQDGYVLGLTGLV
jgi:hypothetical protein